MKAKIVIAGGGITALHIAKLLGSEDPIVVSKEFGGLLSTFSDGEFVFDYGGHVYTTEDERVTDLLVRAGGIAHERNAIYLSDKAGRVPYPVQDQAAQLGITVMPPHYAGPEPVKTFKDWAIMRFGRQFYNEWFEPFNKRVWTADPAEMDIDWVQTRVKTDDKKDKNWGPNATFMYAPSDAIISTMLMDASDRGAKMVKGDIVNVDLERKRLWTRGLKGGKEGYIDYETLYWTLPITMLLPHIGYSGSHFLSNRVRTVGIGFGRQIEIEPFHWAYADVARQAHRITLLSRYHPKMSPNGKDSLIAEYPYRDIFKLPLSLGPPNRGKDYVFHNAAARSVGAYVLRNCGLTGFSWSPGDIEAIAIGDAPGYPIPMLGLRSVVAAAKIDLLSQHQVYPAGRWGSWGYFNIDHCFSDGEAALAASISGAEDDLINYLYSEFYYGPR